jgi:hypothetical protein
MHARLSNTPLLASMLVAVAATTIGPVSIAEGDEARTSPPATGEHAVVAGSPHSVVVHGRGHGAYLSALGDLFDTSGRGEDPESACATSTALDRYLDGIYRMQLARDPARSTDDAADGSVRMRDGIWIVESDDTMLYHDEPQDLAGSSLRFTPDGSGYEVTVEPLQYDPEPGELGIDNASQRVYAAAFLDSFGFPIGGSTFNLLYIGTDLSVRTQSPLGVPVFAFDQYTISGAGADLLRDRADRLSPLFYARGDNWGRYVYVKDTPEKFLITWRTALDPALSTSYLDVQAALYPNGEILYSYRTLQNIDNGAPLVYAGIQDWIDGFTVNVSATDPVEGLDPHVDIVEIELQEDPASDMVRLRTTLAGAIPGSSEDRIDYVVTLSQEGAPVYRFRTWVDVRGRNVLWSYVESVGGTYIREAPSVIEGTHWDVVFSLAKYPDLAPGAVDVLVESLVDEAVVDQASASADLAGGAPFGRDYSAQAPFTTSIPAVESFLLPWFIPHGVKDKVLAHTGWAEDEVDGMPMYQTFYTDLILWAGAYYTYGNCGAANMGRCDPGAPPRLGLMHMNKTYQSFNFPESPGRFTVLSHEFGHRWLQQIDIDEGQGPSSVLNPESPHPAGYVYTEAVADLVVPEDSSVMGGGTWTDNGDGTWSVPADYTYYSYAAYELYLMGMMAPAEVPDWFYLDNTDPPQPRSYWANPGATVTGAYRPVTMPMLLDAMGTRDPVYPDEKRDLFVPMVLVVRPGQEPSAADWEFMMSVRDPWRDAFHTQTQQRGTATTLSPREVSPPGATPLRLDKSGDVLRLVFEDPGFGDQVRYNVYEGALGSTFDDWSARDCGATAGNTGTGELFLDVTPSAGSSYYLVTMSTVAVEGGPGQDGDGVERATTASRCGGL